MIVEHTWSCFRFDRTSSRATEKSRTSNSGKQKAILSAESFLTASFQLAGNLTLALCCYHFEATLPLHAFPENATNNHLSLSISHLRHKRTRRRTLVPPRRRQDADALVVPRQAVDARLDEDEAEFAVLVFAVALEVLADRYGLHPTIPLSARWRGLWGGGEGLQTFLMSMYRSSGISGARPVWWGKSLRQSLIDRAEA